MSSEAIAFKGTRRFELRRRIGAGAMGIVYEAFDHERAMKIALKVLRNPTADASARAKQELRLLSELSHPNLMAMHELHAANGHWFLTMELLEGCIDLATHVGQPPDLERVRDAMAQLARGVAAMHAAGYLHRDIKPSNVLVTREPRVVLADFGVVAQLATPDGARIGTPAYMAPEQASGELSTASDWYAVGVVLYELLTGTLPFDGSSKAVLYDKTRYDPRPVHTVRPDVPGALAELCDGLLKREASARPGEAEILSRLDVAPVIAPRRRHETKAIVGRDREMAILAAAHAATLDGRGSVAWIRGASGLGKTALLDAFLARLPTGVTLRGRCFSNEAIPYKAIDGVVDALARYLSSLPPHEADALLPRDIRLLGRLFPIMNTVPAVVHARRRQVDLEPNELRRRAIAALRELLARLAERETVIVAIDDLQWGDADSLPVLEALLGGPDPPPVLLVLAHRTEDEQRAPLVQALRARREQLASAGLNVIDLQLSSLSRVETHELALALTRDPVAAEIVASESHGVPFLVHELAFAVGTSGSLVQAIDERAAALSHQERLILELVTVAARPLSRQVLATAGRISPEDLELALARLTTSRLLRVTPDENTTGFEVYHDRIREVIAARLSPDQRRAGHAMLATALTDPEALFVHCEAAGELERAGEYALAAATLAEQTLAFDRAASLYRAALQLAPLDAVTARRVRASLGNALAGAGHGEEAAAAYLDASIAAPAAEATELRRRAAMQYLHTGLIDRGLLVLDEALSDVGRSRPRSPYRAWMSLLYHRARLRLRGFAYRPRDATEIPTSALARHDVLWTAATSLGMIDIVVGADFATQQTLLALELGEPMRVARALTTEAMFLAIQGHRTRARTDALLSRVREISSSSDPELPAWASAARAMAHYQRGELAQALGFAEQSLEHLRDKCTTLIWETGGVDAMAMWCLFYLGKYRELLPRVDEASARAERHGNRFDAANVSSGVPALSWAIADRTARGREVVERALAAWHPEGFHLQHYYALLAMACFDLYDQRADEARRRVDATWTKLERSHLLMASSVFIEAHHLRGRVRIAAGLDATHQIGALRTLRENHWAGAMVSLLEAGAHHDPTAAARAFRDAEERCEQAGLVAFAASARRQAGVALGGADGATMTEAADARLTACGVTAPHRLASMLAPMRARGR